MSAEIGSDQVWIMADELPAMEYQPQIEKLITRGRKRGLAVVMGFQNVSQLRSIYGRDGAITLTSSPTTKVILRCDEAETAKWASELLGSREVERMTMTQLAGLSNYREGVNLQPHRSTERIVTPAEIQLLKPLRGYLCVAGSDRTTIRIPERHLEKRQPAFLPRTNVPVATPQKVDERGADSGITIYDEHVAGRAELRRRRTVLRGALQPGRLLHPRTDLCGSMDRPGGCRPWPRRRRQPRRFLGPAAGHSPAQRRGTGAGRRS